MYRYTIKTFNFALCVLVTSVYSIYRCTEYPEITVVGNVLNTIKTAKLVNPGDPIEIYCASKNSSLVLKSETLSGLITKLPTETVNKTTMKHSIKNIPKDVIIYVCEDENTRCKDEVQLISDRPVDLQRFQCLSRNFLYVNCSWSLTNVIAQIKLYVILNNVEEQICEIPVSEYKKEMYCIWDSRRYPKYSNHLTVELKFLLNACNMFGCIAPNFTFEHISIVQISPPVDVIIVNITSSTAILQWKAPDTSLAWSILRDSDTGLEIHNKVEFWHRGSEKHEVDLDKMTVVGMMCQIVLELPCPDTSYEVRVFNKLKNAYWSDFTREYFTTKKSDNVDVDPMCKKPRVALTKDIMAFKLYELAEDVKTKLSEIKKAIDVLKLRSENIQKLL